MGALGNDTAGLGIGIVGFGVMGRTHVRAYRAAGATGRPNRIVAIADRNPASVVAGGPSGNLQGEEPVVIDERETAIVAHADELLANPAVEAVSVCTPTDSHVELALAALRAGKHVLVEKPVALAASDVERLAAAARASGRVCMPAMCLRFWPGWRWLRQAVERGPHGKVRSAVFRRLASPPGWSDFYRDEARSGGALFDLHVHDADFVRWLFGEPASVHATGSLDHVTASYRFENGPPHVVAEGGWDHTGGFPFHMSFTVVFEQATADYAVGRNPPLVLHENGASRALPLEEGTGYDGEIRHFLDCCAGKTEPEATLDEAVGLVRMLEAERACLARGPTR
jgi:predicted dehydrogenase